MLRAPTMHPAFHRLRTRVQPLGHQAGKHLRAIEAHGDLLVARLDRAGVLSHVHLDRTAPAAAEDFARVAAAGQDGREKLILLGTFFAVQHLHQNARSLEQLAYALAATSEPRRAYAAFLERVEDDFAGLVGTYIRHVLQVVLSPAAPGFAVLNVGTPGHQDDVDVVVLDAGDGPREELDRAVARLSSQCLRFASPLDNYVATEAEVAGSCVTIDELRAALGAGQIGFVVVTELMRAELIAGDEELLHRLRQDVTAEYFFRPGRDNVRHELYLRGLLGETRSLLLRPAPPDRVNPKDDGLRLILGLATAFRTIERVASTQTRDVLAELASTKPRIAAPLIQLEESRVFLETFRHIAQLLVAQEEDIAVADEAARENLGRVAAAMGAAVGAPSAPWSNSSCTITRRRSKPTRPRRR